MSLGAAKVPSIRGRLVRALALWSVLWCVALGVAVWLAMREEVDELMDDSLQSAAEGLIGPFAQTLAAGAPGASAASGPSGPSGITPGGRRFVWQLVGHQGGPRVLAAAQGAPVAQLHATPSHGFSDVPGWRVYGLALGRDSQVLYVAQTREERLEAELEVGFALLIASLPMALLAIVWLGARVRQEMQPLQQLSLRLAHHDPLQPGATLGPAAHEELQPVHASIDALATRLARRVAHERAFSAHAAHALRTPLAGIDAQLAVAVREAGDTPLRERLQRTRAAAARLQRVVAALLTMFRSGAEVQREAVDVEALAARLPLEGLALEVSATHLVEADADLLTAAVLNLLDNALRHGATRVQISTPAAGCLQVQDDGPGVDAARRAALQAGLDTQDYAGRMGLGLMLADLVARAHGGALQLPEVPCGFAARLQLMPTA